MQVALSLARRQLGRTHPNPSVGAVIVQNNQIIATGITETGGRPHAETIAIKNAGGNTKDATLYVTLEPCSHHGKTPPCVDAIIASGISTVVIGCRDKNPIVAGSGVTKLRAAGIEVIEGICEADALEVNRGFFSVMEKKRPFIALKIATSLDGKITSPTGQWLTGETARNYGHLLRSKYDAILTGSGTIIADAPQLNCRLNGLEHCSPLRIILDRSGKIEDGHGAWVLGHKSLEENIAEITATGITSILVEAGATLSSAFLERGLVDRVYWFTAPIIVGDFGLCASKSLNKIVQLKRIESIILENDKLEVLECSQE